MDDQATEQSVAERMIAALDAEEGILNQQETQEPETQEEVVEEQEAEAQPEPRKLKLKWNDQEIEKDEEEVISLAQQGFDYTQKTQKLSEERKAIESQAQAIKAQEQAVKEQAEIQAALIKEYAKVTALDEQLADYDKVDWSALTSSDPSRAQILFMQYTQLKDKRGSLINEMSQKQNALQRQQHQRMQEMIAKGQEQLQKDIPGWGVEKATEVRDFLKGLGFNETEISQINDPRLVKAFYDASQMKNLQSNKPQVTNKVANKPPVVKPGSRDPKAAQNSETTKLRQELRKTGGEKFAAALIEKML